MVFSDHFGHSATDPAVAQAVPAIAIVSRISYLEFVLALRADHLPGGCIVRAGRCWGSVRIALAVIASSSAKLGSQVGYRHLLRFSEVKPPFLIDGLKSADLGVMTPRQTIPTSGCLDPSRHVGEIPQALNVVAGDLGDLLVLFPPALRPVPNPVSKPPLATAGHRTKALPRVNPFVDIDVFGGHPGNRRSHPCLSRTRRALTRLGICLSHHHPCSHSDILHYSRSS